MEFLSDTLILAIIGIIGFVLRGWIGKKIESSVQHEYDKKLADYEHSREVRLRAELVADLMAEWIKDKDKLDYHRLNQLSFQAFLWLPPQLAHDLSSTLNHQEGAASVREIIQRIRKHLLSKDDDLEAREIIIFENEITSKNQD